MTHQADKNDLAHALKLTPKDVRIVGFDVPFKNGRHHFNTSRFIRSDGKMMDITSVQPVYYATPSGHFRPLYEVASGGNKSITLKLDWEQKMDMGYVRWLTGRYALLGGAVLMPMSRVPIAVAAVSTFYPDADPETTSVDGALRRSNESTWTLARDNATADTVSDTSSTHTLQVNTDFDCFRIIVLFDTSSLGSGSTIDSAIMSIAGRGTAETNADTTDIDIVSMTTVSNTSLEAADFNKRGSTVFGSQAVSTWDQTDGTYNDITLNASGENNISKTGISKFAYLLARDTDNAQPTGDNSVAFHSAENASGTAKAPKLVVTFTPEASSFIPRVLNVF